jgi:hypothetical protein
VREKVNGRERKCFANNNESAVSKPYMPSHDPARASPPYYHVPSVDHPPHGLVCL